MRQYGRGRLRGCSDPTGRWGFVRGRRFRNPEFQQCFFFFCFLSDLWTKRSIALFIFPFVRVINEARSACAYFTETDVVQVGSASRCRTWQPRTGRRDEGKSIARRTAGSRTSAILHYVDDETALRQQRKNSITVKKYPNAWARKLACSHKRTHITTHSPVDVHSRTIYTRTE